MTAQPCKHRDREPGPVDSPRRTAGPPPPEGNIAGGTASRAGRDSHGGCLTYSVQEAARLTSLSRDLLYDQMRLSNLARQGWHVAPDHLPAPAAVLGTAS
jgi:hypothetical protein